MGERAGRRERPVDPADGPVAAFAVALRKLREEAGGPTYRAMAARAHFSAATLAQAAAGERLPTLPVALAYAEACGGDGEEWRARWEEARAAQREHAARDGGSARAPYRGLARFETEDHDYFFGRSALVERLVTLLETHRFLLVVGPSGCGKSSLLRAGLVPSLRGRAVRVMTPGAHPRLSGEAVDVLVVDQFEETFTLCEDPAERRRFVEELVAAGHTRVVLAVRADFFDRCTHHPDLVEAVRDATVPVGPMSGAELREAIVKPATAAGLIVQRELTARILDEVGGQPGGLPLMSHALLETWRRHHGKALTVEDYEAAGGIHGAVARTSEELHARLTPEQRERLRHLLPRLVTPGEAGAQDTRRPARRAELVTGRPDDPSPLLLERLADARLITLDEETADLAHEALLTAWPRLRGWVEEDRERLRVHRRLTEAADAWQAHDRDPGGLYRGLRLSLAREHLAGRLDTLTPLERDFLTASTAGRRGERRRSRLRTVLICALATVLVITGSLAWQQSRTHDRQEREAHARRVAGAAASLRQSDPKLSMRLSLAAWHLADLPETRANLRTASLQAQQDTFTDPQTGPGTMRWLSQDGRSLFSVGADRTVRWDLETHRAVATTPGPAGWLADTGEGRGDPPWLPILRPASAEEVRVTPRDMATGREDPAPLDNVNRGVEFSPSGRRLVTYRADGSRYRVRVWDTATRRLVVETDLPRKESTRRPWEWPSALMLLRRTQDGRQTLEPDAPDAALSADDTTMVLCVPGAPVRVWDLRTGRDLHVPRLPVLSFKQCQEERPLLSPDGRLLVLATGAEVRLWELPSGRELPRIDEPGVDEIGFSADGAFLATANADELLVWRVDVLDAPVFRHPLAGEHAFDIRIDPAADRVRYLAGTPNSRSWPATVRTLRLNSVVNADWRDESATSALFSPDGSTLATIYANRVELRDVRTGRRLPGPPPVPCETPDPGCHVIAAFRPDGKVLAYGDTHARPFRAELWDLAGRRVVGRADPSTGAGSLAYTRDGASLLVSGSPTGGSLTLWDLGRGVATTTVPGLDGRIALDPAGRLLVTSEGRVADLAAGRVAVRASGPRPASALAFSPDGRFLAAGDQTGQTVLWDGTVRRQLGGLTPTSPDALNWVSALAFSADGSVLAVGTVGGATQLWDTATRQPVGAPITTPAGFVAALAVDRDTLYVAGEHVPLGRYDLSPAAAAGTVCRRAGQGLGPDDWAAYFPGYPYRSTCA
ncbi:nSTAND1 domain-containing NTPase [Streptosporangium saharense]|uniref:WD40 repeat protein/energy-coupling factor transporter ATP-binding protein EcfA2 n=1 Tax=Streptosporangium saharense TaxID=1706840 RepID=A0A7W7QT31_9ACTN|nr:hypothetical protein [Streptosporangium saharense]MBB4918686.1 WD40 repeat protein/energy-coupling factor transporter ATP-binding protein EcfA2 [Streptosporangium saharense]